MTPCGCPGCRAPLNPGLVWSIKDRPEKYCSRDCRDAIWDHYHGGKKEKKMPHVLADDFGDAGVIRRKCDKCGAQILLCWKGPDGEYCSNACKKQAIAEGEKTMTTETTTATAAAPSPIVAGAPAPKKTTTKKAVKAAKKTAPAKKAKTAKTQKAASNGAAKTAFECFRDGTAKAAIAAILSDQKYHPVEDLTKVCDKLKTGHGQIRFALAQMAERAGATVEYRNDNAEVRVTK